MPAAYRIGVDVGGTNTDAAIIDVTATDNRSRGICVSNKTPTTSDVTSGIRTAIVNVLSQTNVNRKEILSVAIGTTHFVNAVVEADARRLSKVAVIRLCGPFTKAIAPFTAFPSRLREIMEGPIFYLDGGREIDGATITPVCKKQVQDATQAIREAGIKTVALVGVFSPLDAEASQEELCKQIILEADPTLSVVCSSAIGSVGLLERENATILNASILALARKTIRAFCHAMKDLELECPLYLTQNDGTLTDAVTAAQYPIKTFASGPTNSLTGAAYLASVDKGTATKDTQVLVMDVGGTTSDICALLPSGFPRKAPNFVEIGGVRTAFSIPEVLSVGLGGGSRVRYDEMTGIVSVGPDSVGYRLGQDAMVFGGDVLTTTDIVVASGKGEIGEPKNVANISREILTQAREEIRKILERGVDDMKVSDLPVTLLLVGGGSIIYMDELQGVANCIIPPHHDSANAVGAAIAKVCGEIDIIEIMEGRDENAVLESAKQKAVEAAVAKGAVRDNIQIVEISKIPLQYTTNKAMRLIIKAVGKLAADSTVVANGQNAQAGWLSEDDDELNTDNTKLTSVPSSLMLDLDCVDFQKYVPDVRNGVWYISAVDLAFIASGTGVLGTGGGGPSYLQHLESLQALEKHGKRMRVVSVNSMQDDDVCVFGSWYGAPSVSSERLGSGTEIVTSIEHSLRISGKNHFEAIIADEIGGGNGMSTFPTSAHYDIPVLDGDLMGRAYPTMAHGIPYVYGHPITPCVIADAKKNVGVVFQAENDDRVEGMLRAQCINLGLMAAASATPLTCDVIKQYSIPNTVSQCWYIGRAIHRARRTKTNVIKAIFDTSPGRLLYSGKVVDVKRDVSRGYTVGEVTIGPLSSEEREIGDDSNVTEGRHLVIPFQNEFLYAAYVKPDNHKEQEIICTVPDLISVLGQDGEAIGSPELRYGLRVDVIAMAAHPLWTGTPEGLKVGGPDFFGLDTEFKSLGPYQQPKSVIDEFNKSC
ncbi:hypothetical protein KEM56_007307 [Ascosphaera pollenicola]|nr:hypothetical protein KEM56_007307 [Ascosphaera pollenicola]